MERRIHYFDLVYRLTVASFKLRNEGNYLGVLWFLLNPLLTFVVLYFVFSRSLGANIPNYPLYLLLGIIQWNFLNLAVTGSMHNILDNAKLIKSLPFPREALIASAVLLAFFSYCFEFIVFMVFLIVTKGITPLAILFPAVLFLEFIFVLGLCLALASCAVFVRDLEHVWLFMSKLWWFLTPIFYAAAHQSNLVVTLNKVNPMAYVIEMSRDLLVYGTVPTLWSTMILIGFAALSYCIGYGLFKMFEHKFAEKV